MELYFEELPVGLCLKKCIPQQNETELVIPTGVTSLAPGALRYCRSINRLTLPSTLRVADADPFACMTALRHISVSPDHPEYFSREGVLFKREGQDCVKLLCYPAGRLDRAYVIPEDVRIIGALAFANSVHLQKVLLHKRLLVVEKYAFAGSAALRYVQFDCMNLLQLQQGAFRDCNWLEHVCIRGKIACIDQNAFSGCARLKHIAFPEGLVYVGKGAFSYCLQLETIALPQSVNFIGEDVFYNCPQLKRVQLTRNVARLIPRHHDIVCIEPAFED